MNVRSVRGITWSAQESRKCGHADAHLAQKAKPGIRAANAAAPHQEISEIVAVPVGTVTSRLSRARALLKTLLVENYNGGRRNEM